MFKYTQLFGNSDDEQMEEVPSQFDQGKPILSSHYDSNKFVQNKSSMVANHPKCKTLASQFLEKNAQYQASRLRKIKDIKTENENRVMANCTFKPVTNRSNSKSPRNVKQFLESQQQHINRTNQKRQWIKQQIEDENKKNMTFSPRINPKKNSRNKENVHSRLYKLKDKDKTDRISTLADGYSYIPKITKKGQQVLRNLPVNELLYKDAQRRANKCYEICKTQSDLLPKNNVNQKFAAQKILKDFKAVLQLTGLKENLIYNQQQLIVILRALGYVRYQTHEQHALAKAERQLLIQCYEYLQQYEVTQINIYVFLLALGGIYNVDLNNDTIDSALVIEQNEGKRIHHYFDLLFRNRLFNASLKNPSKYNQPQENTKLQLSPNSKMMAQRYRCKMIQKTNNVFAQNGVGIAVPAQGLTHQDLLTIYSLGQNLSKEKLRSIKKNQKDPQCTFQPNADKHSVSFNQSRIGIDRCRELYELAKSKQEEASRSPTFRSFENQQKSPKSSSLSPVKRQKSTSSQQKVTSYLQIRDVDKTLSRMVLGRKQRNEKLQFEQRGEKSYRRPQPKKSIQTLQPQEDDLLLDADILVNGVKKKIYIYRRDQDKIQQVVNQFAKSCSLDTCSRDMLFDRLNQAVCSFKNQGDL